jgi:competence protein ComEA
MSGTAYRIAALGGLALVAALLVTVAVVLIVRGNTNAPIQIIAPPGTPEAAHNALPTEPQPDVRVYLHGAVQSPGVYPARPGDRLADVLRAAGGPAADADLAAVNLAQRLRDEGYYYIPRAGETPPPVTTSGDDSNSALPSGSGDNGLINLNTASAAELTTLPGIGEVRARAIVAHREQHGPFTSVEQVMNVSGIGSGIYESIRDLATVGGP